MKTTSFDRWWLMAWRACQATEALYREGAMDVSLYAYDDFKEKTVGFLLSGGGQKEAFVMEIDKLKGRFACLQSPFPADEHDLTDEMVLTFEGRMRVAEAIQEEAYGRSLV